MDPNQPWPPGPPPAPGSTPPVEWASPALGTPAPGNVAPDGGAGLPPAETPRRTMADTSYVPLAAASPVPAPPPAADEVPVIRAIFRDGQRLLYYSVNFARFLTPDRVPAHERIYESVITLALIRLHSGLERLIQAQMPLARTRTSTADADQAANWRDMLLYLRNQYPRLVLPADGAFLTELAVRRNGLARGEILTVDIKQVGHLAELGNTIFTQLDPGYRKWELDPEKDAIPARRASAAPAPAPAMSAAPASSAAPATTPGQPVVNPPPPDWLAAGAQRPRPVPEATGPLYCPTCSREVLPDDLWCPRCGENFTAPGALEPVRVPPTLAATSGSTKRRGVFARLRGVR